MAENERGRKEKRMSMGKDTKSIVGPIQRRQGDAYVQQQSKYLLIANRAISESVQGLTI